MSRAGRVSSIASRRHGLSLHTSRRRPPMRRSVASSRAGPSQTSHRFRRICARCRWQSHRRRICAGSRAPTEAGSRPKEHSGLPLPPAPCETSCQPQGRTQRWPRPLCARVALPSAAPAPRLPHTPCARRAAAVRRRSPSLTENRSRERSGRFRLHKSRKVCLLWKRGAPSQSLSVGRLRVCAASHGHIRRRGVGTSLRRHNTWHVPAGRKLRVVVPQSVLTDHRLHWLHVCAAGRCEALGRRVPWWP